MDLQTLNGDFVKAVHLALKRYHRDKELANHPLARLTIVEEIRRQHEWSNTPQGKAAALREAFNKALSLVEAEDKEQAELLRSRFWRGESVIQMAWKKGMAESTLYVYQEKAIHSFVFALWELERAARLKLKECQYYLQRNLPAPTYTKLFGVDDILTRLQEVLINPEGPWVISIEGLRGLGKTSLAHSLASWAALKGDFADIAWATVSKPAFTWEMLMETVATQLNFSDLLEKPLSERDSCFYALLKSLPYLIVIDNLETTADCINLILKLQKFANPTRFLVTGCYSLSGLPSVFCCALGELKEADAFALMRYESQLKGLFSLSEADEAILRQIYAVTGGNPLAIKLVISQARFLPLEKVIKQMQEAAGQLYRSFYQLIYENSWKQLSNNAKRILLAMLYLPPDGASWEQVQAATGLEEECLNIAIEELVGMSLLRVNNFAENLYSIHRLTHSFLKTGLPEEWILSPQIALG